MTQQPRHINYKSDFILRERFRNKAGDFVKLPDGVDFELRYWVRPHRIFVASRVGGVYSNCLPDGDSLLVVFKDHGLCEGTLNRELHLRLDNDFMPDGVQNIYTPADTAVVLWQFAGDSDGVIESDILAAYTRGPAFTYSDFTPEQLAALKGDKGDPFTWEDFTPAQIEILKKPAADAAALANKAANDATNATKDLREQAQQLAQTSEQAVGDCTAATTAANKSKSAADSAARSALDAATEANAQRELTEQSRRRLEAVADRAELAASPIPDGLRVAIPAPVTLRNPVPRFIEARVLPAGALQNIIFQAFGGAARVEPDGMILPFRPGVARVHVIPTAGTRFYKTVEVHVVAPALRMAAPGALRLDASGNIRLT